MERLNHPVAPLRRRPSNATLVVTRPLGATIGRVDPSCPWSHPPNATTVNDTDLVTKVDENDRGIFGFSKVRPGKNKSLGHSNGVILVDTGDRGQGQPSAHLARWHKGQKSPRVINQQLSNQFFWNTGISKFWHKLH